VVAIIWGGAKLSQPYYLYVVPPFALLGACAAQWLWDLPGRTQRVRQALAIAAGLMLFAATSSFQRNVTLRILHERWPVPSQTSTVEEIGFGSAPILPRGGSLYIWGGETQLYLLSNSQTVTRHLHGFFLSKMHSVDPSYLERREELMTDLRRHLPETILIDPRAQREDPVGVYAFNVQTFPALEALLAEKYERLPDYKDWQGYRLRS
jgi:hypothetical protein